MKTETLDSIHQSFVDWRGAHRFGAYPQALKQRALACLCEAELVELGARLGIAVPQIERWGVQSTSVSRAPVDAEVGSNDAFVELRPSAMLSPPAAPCGVEVELCMPSGGPVLRLRGAVDSSMLRALIQSVQVGNAS